MVTYFCSQSSCASRTVMFIMFALLLTPGLQSAAKLSLELHRPCVSVISEIACFCVCLHSPSHNLILLDQVLL